MHCAASDPSVRCCAFSHQLPCDLLLVCMQVQEIDFFDSSPFPSYDVITMGMILHDWGLEKKKLLMKKARSSKPA
jgi:hypothetical protein